MVNTLILKLSNWLVSYLMFLTGFNNFYSNRNPYFLYPIIFIMIFKFKSSEYI